MSPVLYRGGNFGSSSTTLAVVSARRSLLTLPPPPLPTSRRFLSCKPPIPQFSRRGNFLRRLFPNSRLFQMFSSPSPASHNDAVQACSCPSSLALPVHLPLSGYRSRILPRNDSAPDVLEKEPSFCCGCRSDCLRRRRSLLSSDFLKATFPSDIFHLPLSLFAPRGVLPQFLWGRTRNRADECLGLLPPKGLEFTAVIF